MYDPCRIDAACAERDRLERHRAQEAEMSMMRCDGCDELVDTDEDVECWVGPRGRELCLCPACREEETDGEDEGLGDGEDPGVVG